MLKEGKKQQWRMPKTREINVQYKNNCFSFTNNLSKIEFLNSKNGQEIEVFIRKNF